MGFRSLQRSRKRKSLCGGFARADAFRLQGLTTLLAVYSFRAPAGFVSHRRRSWDSPFGASSSRKVSGAFPPGRTHIPFLLPLIPLPKQRAGPAGRGFWASTLAGVPGSRHGISAPTTGCSLGFRPSRVCRPKPWPGFRPASSHTLRTCACAQVPASQSFNRLRLGPTRQPRQAAANGQVSPSRVSAPAQSQTFWKAATLAIDSPRTAPHITADRQVRFGWSRSPCRS
jgi:hypothetical protein